VRILIISHEFPPIGGGGANACMYLAREYAQLGNDVDIITVWFNGEQDSETIDDYTGKIRINRLHSKRTRKDSCSFIEMLDFVIKALPFSKRLVRKRLLAQQQYHICHIFFGIPSGVVGIYLKKKYGLPYVVRFGGGDIPGFQERFRTLYKVIGPFVRIIWKNADGLVANSKGLRDFAYSFCSKYPVDIIYNGVDTKTFYCQEDKQEAGKVITLLFVSRLIERKGLQFLIPHLKDIQEKTGRIIKLLVVGDGPYKNTLASMADSIGVSDIIEFVGQKDKNELLQYYHRGDIFVFPSKKEGMPNSVLEAMACGLPIVMSPCQGSEELIEGNGVIAEKEPENYYKSVIDMLFYSNAYLTQMGLKSRDIVESKFSWRKCADKYLNLFNNIIECKGDCKV